MKNVLCFIVSVQLLLVCCFATGSPDLVVGESSEVTESGEVQFEEVLPETAVSEPESIEVIDEVEMDPVDDGATVEDEVVEDDGSPIPVIIVPDDVSFALFDTRAASSSGLVIPDSPPSDIPFYGAGYITGTSSSLGTVTLWFPIDYTGDWGVDSNGYLINVTSGSKSGYLEGVYNNSVSAQAFSYPRYRTTSSSYDYTTLYLTPTASNMDIAVEMAPSVSFADMYPYIMIMLVGVVIVCFMKR